MNSNLGKGKIWYFKCQFTETRCKKLYYYNRYFRSANDLKGMINVCYDKQTESKKFRSISKRFKQLDNYESAVNDLNYNKNLKRTYKGKKTNTVQKLEHTIQNFVAITHAEFMSYWIK